MRALELRNYSFGLVGIKSGVIDHHFHTDNNALSW